MAKKGKGKNQAPVSGGFSFHEAESALIKYLTQMSDGDEVLRKAGITRHRLSVMMYDDEIYQCIEKRQDRLESAPWRLEATYPDRPETLILQAHLKEWWSEIVLGAQNARWYGYSVLEAVYNEADKPLLHIDGDTITPFNGFSWIGVKPMQWYRPQSDGRLMLLANHNASKRDMLVDQQYKHFLTRCKSSYENPLGEALLSRLYWVWFFKTSGFKFWAKFVEKFGMPMLIGKSATGQNEAMRDALLRAHSSSVIAIQTSDSVEVNASGTNGNASQTFEDFDKNLERRVQKVILGQTLTSGTDGAGSRALGDVHLEVQNDKFKADVRMILPTIQTIVNALCDVNGWQRHTIIIGEEKSLEMPKAERDAKLKQAGAEFSNQYFQREYGLIDGDLKEPQVLGTTQFTALPQQAFRFAAKPSKVDKDQAEIDELADSQSFKLLDNQQLKELIFKSESPEELANNLMLMIPEATKQQFNAQLDEALYAASVFGVIASSGG